MQSPRRFLFAALAAAPALAACVGPTVKVTPLSPAPRVMAPRRGDAVGVRMAPPTEAATDVFRIDASGGSDGELLGALRTRAANLGCDAIVVQDTRTPERVQKAHVTGQLIEHRDTTAAHASALCVIFVPTGG